MTDDQKLHLTVQLAEISQKATRSPGDAAFILMVSALSICRTFKVNDAETKQTFADLVDLTGARAPAELRGSR